jgi:hypothetical protein
MVPEPETAADNCSRISAEIRIGTAHPLHGHAQRTGQEVALQIDREAIAKAERFVNGRAVELWEGARFIVRFPASS